MLFQAMGSLPLLLKRTETEPLHPQLKHEIRREITAASAGNADAALTVEAFDLSLYATLDETAPHASLHGHALREGMVRLSTGQNVMILVGSHPGHEKSLPLDALYAALRHQIAHLDLLMRTLEDEGMAKLLGKENGSQNALAAQIRGALGSVRNGLDSMASSLRAVMHEPGKFNREIFLERASQVETSLAGLTRLAKSQPLFAQSLNSFVGNIKDLMGEMRHMARSPQNQATRTAARATSALPAQKQAAQRTSTATRSPARTLQGKTTPLSVRSPLSVLHKGVATPPSLARNSGNFSSLAGAAALAGAVALGALHPQTVESRPAQTASKPAPVVPMRVSVPVSPATAMTAPSREVSQNPAAPVAKQSSIAETPVTPSPAAGLPPVQAAPPELQPQQAASPADAPLAAQAEAAPAALAATATEPAPAAPNESASPPDTGSVAETAHSATSHETYSPSEKTAEPHFESSGDGVAQAEGESRGLPTQTDDSVTAQGMEVSATETAKAVEPDAQQTAPESEPLRPREFAALPAEADSGIVVPVATDSTASPTGPENGTGLTKVTSFDPLGKSVTLLEKIGTILEAGKEKAKKFTANIKSACDGCPNKGSCNGSCARVSAVSEANILNSFSKLAPSSPSRTSSPSPA